MHILIALFWLGLIIALASTIFSLVMSVPIIIIGMIAGLIELIIKNPPVFSGGCVKKIY